MRAPHKVHLGLFLFVRWALHQTDDEAVRLLDPLGRQDLFSLEMVVALGADYMLVIVVVAEFCSTSVAPHSPAARPALVPSRRKRVRRRRRRERDGRFTPCRLGQSVTHRWTDLEQGVDEFDEDLAARQVAGTFFGEEESGEREEGGRRVRGERTLADLWVRRSRA